MATAPANIYPKFSIAHIKNPIRFWAFPVLGGLLIIMIPVFLELMVLGIYTVVITMFINSLVVLVSGKYWRHCYNMNVGILKLGAKIHLYFIGLTNKYPGFSLGTNGFDLNFTYPQASSRYFAIPVFGGIARLVLLIPYIVYMMAISKGAFLGVIISSLWVLFKGRYPETSYEFARDALRLNISEALYFAGISDKYPSFYISLNHATLKLLLIIIAVSSGGWGSGNSNTNSNSSPMNSNYNYQNMNYTPGNNMMPNVYYGKPAAPNSTNPSY
jgi:hypothetical protein